ncbi:ribosomal protein L7/L12 [Paenibacillus favisporus]|uniref:Ribosomal protein L7/L12 n=1 Tax=Paenibacillus favisporus TaxID=221028 RepID=A0ABV2F9A8_9BACL
MEYILIIISLLIIINLWAKVSKLEGRIKGMQYTINQLTQQSGLPENPINDELRQLIKEGEDVKAIKKARETLGLSLLEGKEYIDKLKSETR